jgi:hypothetical protein
VTIIPDRRRLFGVDFFCEMYSSSYRVSRAMDCAFGLEFEPGGPLTRILAERWRRVGFTVLRLPAFLFWRLW